MNTATMLAGTCGLMRKMFLIRGHSRFKAKVENARMIEAQ